MTELHPKLQQLIERMAPDVRERFIAAIDAGWRLETDWHKIAARYTDMDLADAVPREIIYHDMGVLVSRIDILESFLDKLGYRVQNHA